MESIYSQLTKMMQNIKVIVSDVDGVLTDGHIYINEEGHEPLARFSIHDGLGVILARENDIKIIILSGRQSLCTEARYKYLGVTEVHTGVENKKQKLFEICNRLNLNLAEIAYIGDDLIDLSVMNCVGFKVAPKNAVKAVREISDYVTQTKGGSGALRELIDLILEAQGKYTACINRYLA